MVKDIIKTVTFSCMLAGSMFVTCHVCAAGSVVNITGNVQDNTCDVDINSRNLDVSLEVMTADSLPQLVIPHLRRYFMSG